MFASQPWHFKRFKLLSVSLCACVCITGFKFFLSFRAVMSTSTSPSETRGSVEGLLPPKTLFKCHNQSSGQAQPDIWNQSNRSCLCAGVLLAPVFSQIWFWKVWSLFWNYFIVNIEATMKHDGGVHTYCMHNHYKVWVYINSHTVYILQYVSLCQLAPVCHQNGKNMFSSCTACLHG